MIRWWNDNLTLYNKYTDPITRLITWYRTVLTNSFYMNQSQNIQFTNVQIKSNNQIARIPQNDKYLPEELWEKIPSDLMSNYFTFSVGDIIVNGIVEDEINEYEQGKRSNDLVAKYQTKGVFRIQKLQENTSINPKHYYLVGV